MLLRVGRAAGGVVGAWWMEAGAAIDAAARGGGFFGLRREFFLLCRIVGSLAVGLSGSHFTFSELDQVVPRGRKKVLHFNCDREPSVVEILSTNSFVMHKLILLP